MSEQRRKFFDRLAGDWDDLYYQDKKINRRLDRLVSKFRLGKDSTILDLGCGTGVISQRLARLSDARGRVIGCDYSLPMLKTARLKDRNAVFLCAEAQRLPFKSGCLETIVCFSCFPHFEDKRGALREAGRITSKGGRLIISHLLSRVEIQQLHRKLKRGVSGDRIPSKKWMVANLKKAGFRISQFLDRKGLYLVQADKIE